MTLPETTQQTAEQLAEAINIRGNGPAQIAHYLHDLQSQIRQIDQSIKSSDILIAGMSERLMMLEKGKQTPAGADCLSLTYEQIRDLVQATAGVPMMGSV